MAGKKALFVGINKFAKYSQFTLNGCVNDAKDMAALYKDLLGFKASEMTVLTDAQATKANIMANLKSMVADAKAGKLNYLVFSLSSHGTQMNDTSGDEPDGKDEAFVPHDIAEKSGSWDPAHIISDDELHDLFASCRPLCCSRSISTPATAAAVCAARSSACTRRGRATSRRPITSSAEKTAKMRGFTLQRPPSPIATSAPPRPPQQSPPASTTCCGPAARPTKPAPTPTSTAATTAHSPTTSSR